MGEPCHTGCVEGVGRLEIGRDATHGMTFGFDPATHPAADARRTGEAISSQCSTPQTLTAVHQHCPTSLCDVARRWQLNRPDRRRKRKVNLSVPAQGPRYGRTRGKNPTVDHATRHHRVVPEHLDQDLPGAESVVHQPGGLFSNGEPSRTVVGCDRGR